MSGIVGNIGNPEVEIWTITKDSLGADGSVYIEYNNGGRRSRIIDTSYQVFYLSQYTNNKSLIYKLDADSGDVWKTNPNFNDHAWVSGIQ